MENKETNKRSRYLTSQDDVFVHNAWDDVEWDNESLERAKQIVQKQMETPMPDDRRDNLLRCAGENWDQFYKKHGDRFFKDRKWFSIEYPELFERPSYLSADDQFCVFEVGCGVGNSLLPIVEHNQQENFYIHACDFSKTAIDVIKQNDLYKQNESRCNVFVHDISDGDNDFELFERIPEHSVDIVLMVYVLSAVAPDRMLCVMKRINRLLKPGGLLLFRDYGRYDLVQLRFKPGRMVKENMYARGDGTLVYFFTQDEMNDLALESGFEVVENEIDRRLLVNRQKQLKMYRSWLQCKFRKRS